MRARRRTFAAKRGILLRVRPARWSARRTSRTTSGSSDGSATLQPTTDVQRVAAREGIDTTQPTVSFCNTGHWAATNWFVLSEVLGQKDVKLYPESMVGWSRAGLPMANVPSRLEQFWMQLKEAAGAM